MSPDFQHHVLLKIARLLDLAIVCAMFLAALAISSSSLTWPSLAQVLVIRIKVANLFLFVGYLGLSSAVFCACGFYRSQRLSRWMQRLYEIFLAVTLLTALLWLLRWPLALEFATDAFLPLFWVLTLGALMLSHEIARLLLLLARLRGRNLRNIIIVGEGPEAASLASRISQEANLGYRVLRVIDAGEMTENGRTIGDV
jgi:FlaA1/EpsC-like NDP-sugar epimerase